MMKKLLTVLLILCAVQAYGQFRMVGTGTWSTVNDSTYSATVTFQTDLTGMGYLATAITTDFRLWTGTEQLYTITSATGLTFSSATLTVQEYQGDHGVPVGLVMVFDPDGRETLPEAPFGSTGSTAQMDAAITTHNARVLSAAASADGNGLFSASNNNDTTEIDTAYMKNNTSIFPVFAFDNDRNVQLFCGLEGTLGIEGFAFKADLPGSGVVFNGVSDDVSGGASAIIEYQRGDTSRYIYVNREYIQLHNQDTTTKQVTLTMKGDSVYLSRGTDASDTTSIHLPVASPLAEGLASGNYLFAVSHDGQKYNATGLVDFNTVGGTAPGDGNGLIDSLPNGDVSINAGGNDLAITGTGDYTFGTTGDVVLGGIGPGETQITIDGTAGAAIEVATTGGIDFNDITLHTDSGSPEGTVTANPGSLYFDESGTDRGLQFKDNGTGNTGWTAVVTDTAVIPNPFVIDSLQGTDTIFYDCNGKYSGSARYNVGGYTNSTIYLDLSEEVAPGTYMFHLYDNESSGDITVNFVDTVVDGTMTTVSSLTLNTTDKFLKFGLNWDGTQYTIWGAGY